MNYNRIVRGEMGRILEKKSRKMGSYMKGLTQRNAILFKEI